MLSTSAAKISLVVAGPNSNGELDLQPFCEWTLAQLSVEAKSDSIRWDCRREGMGVPIVDGTDGGSSP